MTSGPTDGREGPSEARAQRVRRLIDEIAASPVLDDRSPEEIIGYDEHGVPVDAGTTFSLTDIEVVRLD